MSIVCPVFGTLNASSAQNTRDYPISAVINGGNSIRRYYYKVGIAKINATRNAKIFPFVARFRVSDDLTFKNGCCFIAK